MEELIKNRMNCETKEAAQIAKDLQDLVPELRRHLDAWIENEAYQSDEMYEGYSLSSLMRDYKLNFTGAILTLNWLISDPATAKKALKYGIR